MVSLLQYMKCTTLDNENVTEKDERILDLDKIVREVKQSEEWEACKGLEISVEEYEEAKRQIARWEDDGKGRL